MSDNNCWYKLKISVENALKPDWKLPTTEEPLLTWQYQATDMFNTNWISTMRDIGLEPISGLVFYRNYTGLETCAHIDGNGADRKPVFALNWVIGGANSTLIWYKLPDYDASPRFTKIQTPYQAWLRKDLEEIDRVHIGSHLTLVRIDKPHAVEMGTEPRWCISVRTKLPEPSSWEEILEILREKQLLIET